MGMGKHEEAYAMSSTLIRNSQNNSKLLITRARCLYLMGNLDSAIKHLQACRWRRPVPPPPDALSSTLLYLLLYVK